MNTVIVASGSKELFASVQHILGEGHDVHLAPRLPDLFASLAKRPADVVLVDTRLEDCDGRTAVHEIRGLFPEVVVVYFSPELDGKGAGISEEDDAYVSLRKPLDQQLLRLAVKKAAEKRNLSRRIDYLLTATERATTPWRGSGLDHFRPASHPAHGGVERGMLRKLLKSLSPITSLDKLLGLFADSIRELLGCNTVAVFIWDSQKGRYVTGAWQGVDEGLAVVCSFSGKHGIVRWLIERQQLLTRDKLTETVPYDVAAEVGTDMDALRAELIMPLLDRGNLIGFLCLGTRLTCRPYDESDLELLTVIGDCASGSIGTALLYREILRQKGGADAILSSIACGVVAVDTEGRIVALNSYARNALEVSADELIGKNIQKLGSVLADMSLRTIRENQTFVNRPYKDGTTGRVLSVSTCRLFDDRSNLAGAIVFFTPLLETASSKVAEHGQPEGERFAAFCGHIADKIKNPLASIKTFSQLLAEKFDDQEFREKFAEIVGKAVERINALADSLTSYAADGPMDLSSTNIAAVLENALASLRESMDKRNLRVIVPGNEKPARVLADGQLIRAALLNVLKNSIESTPPDGTITVSIKEVSAGEIRRGKSADLVYDDSGIASDGDVLACPSGSRNDPAFGGAARAPNPANGGTSRAPAARDDEMFVLAEVRDNGVGIPPETIAKVGEPFFTTKEQRAGLGLAIVRRIISRHHGRIEIESDAGKGTAVRIILPRDPNSR